jgi:hypothetical protein
VNKIEKHRYPKIFWEEISGKNLTSLGRRDPVYVKSEKD